MRRRVSRRHARLATERLERRHLLAASALTATVAGDVLTLVGDDLDSTLTIRVETSAVVLTPASDTRINGGDPGVAVTLQGVVRSLKADLKGGNDSLTCDASAPLSLPGGATVQLGSGNNQLYLGGAVQFRYQHNFRDEYAAGENNDFTHGFSNNNVN